MNSFAHRRRAADDRPVGLRTRGDLQSISAPLGDQQSVVVKDPVSGEAFHFSPQEHCLLEALRKPVSLRELARLIEARFPPQRAAIGQLQQFVVQLYEQGLLASDRPEQAIELLERGRRRRRRERWTSLLQVLAVRVASFSAGPAIEWIYARLRWLCTPWACLAAAVLVIGAATTTVAAAPELGAQLAGVASLFRPHWLPLWIALVAAVKICHELGHAVVCRHFGARPQEAGVLLLMGAPALYCDVSDAWRLPSKWQRMAVSSAGVYVELLIAAAAAIVWRFAPPGPVSVASLSLIVVCSVGTLLVNLNPLLRYDGYFVLADWLEVPNLAERARGLIAAAWRGWLLGEPAARDPWLGPGKRRALWIFAVLSKIYLAIVLVGALIVFLKLARPHGLENIVYSLAVVVAAGLALAPAISTARLLANPSLRARIRWGRSASALVVAVALTAAVLAIPVSRRVTAPLAAMPADARPVFAAVAGQLEFAAPVGSWVTAGDAVVRLANPDFELAYVQQQGKVRELEVRLEQLRTLRAAMPSLAKLLPATQAELADARAQLADQQALGEQLVIRAPVTGRVLAPPEQRPRVAAGDRLSSMTGSPLAPRNLGAWIERGAPLAVIDPEQAWIAWAGVDEADAPVVRPGQQVRVWLQPSDAEAMTGRVQQVSQRARRNEPADAPADPSGNAGREDGYHVVEISLDPGAAPMLPGARGAAKIVIERSTVGELLLLHARRALQRVL